jgi:hypothetical protein
MQESELPLREFVYFDREKVVDFVSELQGGLPEKHRRISSQKSARFDFGLKWLLSLGRKGGTKELTWEEIQSETNASLFERLHKLLQERESATKLESFNADIWEQLKVGEFVEVPANVEFSALEKLFDLLKGISEMVEKLDLEQVRDSKWAMVVNYVNLLVSKQEDYNIRINPLGAPSEKFIFVASLSKDKTRASKVQLASEYTVFGRLQHKLTEKETFELQRLLPVDIQLPREQVDDFLKRFKDMPSMLGSPPEKEDLEIPYPAIILTPIAIYR